MLVVVYVLIDNPVKHSLNESKFLSIDDDAVVISIDVSPMNYKSISRYLNEVCLVLQSVLNYNKQTTDESNWDMNEVVYSCCELKH